MTREIALFAGQDHSPGIVTVFEAANLKAGMKLLEKESIDVALCDVKLPDGTGVEFVTTAKQKFPQIEIILLAAYGNIPDGVQP